jgi:hypothetical protein
MSDFQIALALGAAVAALICIVARRWRGLIWIGAGLASFVVSTWYARQELIFAPGMTGFCDALVCFAIFGFADEKWERYVGWAFIVSVAASTFYLADWIGPHWAYIAFLEVLNWLALCVIGGTPILEWTQDAVGARWRVVGHLRSADRLGWARSSSPRDA